MVDQPEQRGEDLREERTRDAQRHGIEEEPATACVLRASGARGEQIAEEDGDGHGITSGGAGAAAPRRASRARAARVPGCAPGNGVRAPARAHWRRGCVRGHGASRRSAARGRRAAGARPAGVSETRMLRPSAFDRRLAAKPARSRRRTTVDAVLWSVRARTASDFTESGPSSPSCCRRNSCAFVIPVRRSTERADRWSESTRRRRRVSASRRAWVAARLIAADCARRRGTFMLIST